MLISLKIVSFNYGNGLAAWLGEKKQQRFLPSFRINKPDGMHSFILTPMVIQGNLRGMINIAHSKHNFFNAEDAEFMRLIAGQLAAAMEWLFSMRHLNAQNIELKRVNETLADTLDELHKAQEKLVDYEKKSVVSEMSVSLNHEINNPLAVIIAE